MNSLEKLCLCSVACNASSYEIADFKALNVYVLQQLVSYLGAYQLNRLHDVFVEARVKVERVWKRHLRLHWNSAGDFPATVFNSDNVRGSGTDPRRVYLERLFQKIISNLDSGSDELPYITKLKWLPRCRHGICFQCLDSTALDSNILRSELLQYADHVRILSVAATSPMIQYLLKHPGLLKILQRNVRRLDTHYINVRNFSATWELVRLFVQEGSVSEFSVFKARLPSALLENLLSLVSGQQAEQDLGSLSDPVEHPLADQASTSTEEKEQGGCSGHDGVDVPHTIKMVDVNETSSLASEDSVASDFDIADDDLYNFALTTSGSNANSSGSGLCCLILEDPLSLHSAKGSSSATIEPTGCSTSSCNECEGSTSHLRNTQSGCEHSSCAVSNSETFSILGSCSLSPCSVSPPRSCTSFAMAYCSSVDALLRTVLIRVLRNWTALQKLALFEISGCRSCGPLDFLRDVDLDTSAADLPVWYKRQRMEREELRSFFYKSIQSNRLTHIVSYEADLGVDIVDVVARASLTKQNDHPLEEIKIILNPSNFIRFETLSDFTENFFGTVCLNFCQSYLGAGDDEAIEFVMSWIRCDRALKCLHLPSFDESSYLTETLQILETNQRLEELHLDTNTFDERGISLFISVLQSCPSLRKLSLIDCDLSKTLIDGKLFVEAISKHPTLTELSLRHNYLEDVGCDLLKAICLRNAFFKSLDLSFNGIDCELLFKTCQEIQAELTKQRRSRFPLLELDLSGNIFYLEWRKRLIQTLMDCVDVFVAQDPNLGNPAGPLADHIAQM